MATSLSDLILQQIQEAQTAAYNVRETTKRDAMLNERASMKLAEAATAQSAADAAIAREREQGQIAIQEARARLREKAGGESKLLSDMEAIVAGGNVVMQKTQEVVRKRNRSIFDLVTDPIETIKDFVTLEQSETELEGAVLQTTNLTTTTAQRYQALTQGNAEIESTKIVSNAATLQAIDAKQLAIQAENLTKAEIQGRAYNLDAVRAALQAEMTDVDLASKALSTEQAVEQMRMARERMSIDRAQNARAAEAWKVQKEQMAKQAVKEQQAEDEIAYYESAMRRGLEVLGQAVPPSIGMRSRVMQAVRNPNSKDAELLDFGLQNMSMGPKSARFGVTPAESATVIDKFNVFPNEQMKPVLAILQRAQETLAKNPQLDRKKDPAKWDAAFNKQVNQEIDNAFSNPGSNPITNVGPHLGTYITQMPDVASLPFVKTVISPFMQAGQPVPAPEQLATLGIAAVREGRITSEQFTGGMATLMSKSMNAHMKAFRLEDFGIVIRKAGVQYQATLPGAFGFNTSTIDLTDRVSLKTWMASELARQMGTIGRMQSGQGLGLGKAAGAALDANQTRFSESVQRGARESYLNNPNYGNPAGVR